MSENMDYREAAREIALNSMSASECVDRILALLDKVRQAQATQYAKVGDELNQCLQAIITNAGNIAESDTSVENHAAARTIESMVQRAAKAIRGGLS